MFQYIPSRESELTEQHLLSAMNAWAFRNGIQFDLDETLEPFLSEQKSQRLVPPTLPPQGVWLKYARTALMLSQRSVAKKMGISCAAYSLYEEREAQGTITLQALTKAAEALDCELVYSIRPKAKIKFAQLIWSKLLADVVSHPWVKSRPATYKVRALVHIAQVKMNDPKIRRKHGWTIRKFTTKPL